MWWLHWCLTLPRITAHSLGYVYIYTDEHISLHIYVRVYLKQPHPLHSPLSLLLLWLRPLPRPIFLESNGIPSCGTLAVLGSDAEEDRLARDEWYTGEAGPGARGA